MAERHLGDRPQLVELPEVHHRVVDQHRVERPPELEGPHVSEEVLAVEVDLLAEREHRGREIHQRAAESFLQMPGIVAGA